MDYFKQKLDEPFDIKIGNSRKLLRTILKWTLLFLLLLIIIIVIIVFSANSKEDSISLISFAIRNQTLNNSIIIPKSPLPATQFASEELQSYIQKCVGVSIPIITSEFDTKSLSSLNLNLSIILSPNLTRENDGFHIYIKTLENQNKSLIISASPERGLLYGVYEIIEKYLNVRWYTSWVYIIPTTQKSLSFPSSLNYDQTPALDERILHWYDISKNDDFAAKMRVHRTSKTKYGGEPQKFKFSSTLDQCHTFQKLLPPGEFFSDHPEYFAFCWGHRVKYQPCLTNPDVLKIMTERVLEKVRKDYPNGARIFGVSQNDDIAPCECDKCKKVDEEEGSHAGTLIRFVNAIADEVKKEFPDVLIQTLVYQYTRTPPLKTVIRDNVVITLCSSGCEYSRPFDKSPYEGNKKFMLDAEGWKKQIDLSNKNSKRDSKYRNFLFIWNYDCNWKGLIQPFPNFYSLQGNMQIFKKYGAKAIYEEGNNQGIYSHFGELRTFLLAKLMWNPDVDLDKLVNEFFIAYYGPAAPYVKIYFDELHKVELNYSKNESYPLTTNDKADDTVFSEEFLDWASEVLKIAKEKAEKSDNKDLYVKNVFSTSIGVEYLRARKGAVKYYFLDKENKYYKLMLKKQELTKYVLDAVANEPRIKLSLNTYPNGNTTFEMKDYLNYTPIINDGKVQIASNRISIEGGTSRAERVEDKECLEGSCIKMVGEEHEVSARIFLKIVKSKNEKPNVKVRFRVKVNKKDGADNNCAAFRAGIQIHYNDLFSQSRFKIGQVANDGWNWYEIKKNFLIDEDISFYMAANFRDSNPSCVKEVILDRLEVIQVIE